VHSIVFGEAHTDRNDVAAADFKHHIHRVPATDDEDAILEGDDAVRGQRLGRVKRVSKNKNRIAISEYICFMTRNWHTKTRA